MGCGVGKYDRGLKVFCFFGSHVCVSHDYDYVARLDLACSRAVQAYHARSCRTRYGVSVKTFAVVIVDDVDTFALHYIGGFHQVCIDGYTPYII